ncbi:hypothetical protein ACFW16_21735 [Inquilinus sp. NPDC058860]|uniref:hypothetical protein n=1 Tax=Inquilinus sp. NPDC058860 TaxID=3346652 RepID=UPI003681030D
MNEFLTFGLFVVCIALMIQGLRRRGGIYGFPFLAGATFLGFIVPQMVGLAHDRFLPVGAFEQTAVFTILCAVMCGVGWAAGDRPATGFRWMFDEKRLLYVAAGMSLLGAYFYFALSRLPAEARMSTMPTGTAVMYLFFARMLTYGFMLSVLCFGRRPSRIALAIALFDSLFVIDRILMGGKRGEFIEFGMAILLVAWFQRGWVLPRTLAVGAVLLAILGLNSIGDYRNNTRQQNGPTIEGVSSIDVLGNFRTVLQNGGPEMRNAIYLMDAQSKAQDWDYGIYHWNVLVWNFVPAQLVGQTFKQSLVIPTFDDRNYVPDLGSTETGMADAFGSFYYLGAFKFFLVAYFLSRVYRAACSGWALAQIIYILCIAPGMLTVTHHTQWVPSTLVHFALLFLPCLLFARIRRVPNDEPPIIARRAVPAGSS